jgi:hypothetical protein
MLKQNQREERTMKRVILFGLLGIVVLVESGCAPIPVTGFSRYREVGDSRGSIAVPTSSFVTIGTLALPAGSYVVTASLYFTNDSPDPGIAYCTLLVGDRNAQAIDSVPAGQAVSQALTVASHLVSMGSATLKCRNNGAGGNLSVQTFNINSIRVVNLTFQ